MKKKTCQLQRELYQRFKSNCSNDTTGDENSSIGSDTIKSKASVIKLNATTSTASLVSHQTVIEETVSVHKSNSDLEISPENQRQQQQQQDIEMAENQNGTENDGGEQRKLSVSEQTEVDDKFPHQMAQSTTKINANWNMMELGEKRKRLR